MIFLLDWIFGSANWPSENYGGIFAYLDFILDGVKKILIFFGRIDRRHESVQTSAMLLQIVKRVGGTDVVALSVFEIPRRISAVLDADLFVVDVDIWRRWRGNIVARRRLFANGDQKLFFAVDIFPLQTDQVKNNF